MTKRRPQRGMILLGLMLVLILAAGMFLLQRANGTTATALDREAKIVAAMTAARDALLARAVLDANRPGSLPCPDIKTNISGNVPGDGKADMLAGNACPADAGWLPWRTLDMNDPRDASGTSLWYVLSPGFQDSDTFNGVNTADLSLDGQGDIVALIIAPGGALAGQSRPSNNIADYLDDLNGNPATSNRDGGNRYFSGPAGSQFNDRLIPLTRTMWLNGVAMRILGEIRYAVANAEPVGGPLPEADADGDGIPDPDNETGFFPYLDATYADIPSPTWKPTTKKDKNGQSTLITHKWHESLANSGWFSQVTYDRTERSISLSGHTVVLP